MIPFLSVIVPVYKVEPYLRQCLDSILGQTFKDMEIILVDDGSPDSCPAICDEYAEKDLRIQVIHQPNGGPGKARKTGVKICQGSYITFVDSDDWIEPDMYQVMWERIQENRADILTTDYFYERKGNSVRYTTRIPEGVYKGNRLEAIRKKMIYCGKFCEAGVYPTMWNKWFRREILIPNLERVDESLMWGEDLACTCACLLDAESVEIYKTKCFYHYRYRSQSITNNIDSGYFHHFYNLYRYMEQYLTEKGRTDILEQLKYHKVYSTVNGFQDIGQRVGRDGFNNVKKKLKDCCRNPDIAWNMKDIRIGEMKLPFYYRQMYRAISKEKILRILLFAQLMRVQMVMDNIYRSNHQEKKRVIGKNARQAESRR